MAHLWGPRSAQILRYVILPTFVLTPLIMHFYRQRRSITVQEASGSEPPRKCRYRLDHSTSDVFALPDGRKLGYAQYGPLTGRPILAFHGIPGSRLEAAMWEDILVKHNARMISIDRPGIGWSSPQPNRTILDHAKDAQQLADHLGLEKYLVMGASGGGPYALACAHAMPDKLKGVAVLCGLGAPDMSKRGMSIQNRLGFTYIYRFAPWIPHLYFWLEPGGRLDLDDETRLRRLQKQFSPEKLHERDLVWARDTEYRDDVLRVVLSSCRETYAQGFAGVLLDGKLLSCDFGFRLEDIRKDLPVQLWYGKHDTNVPVVHGEESAARIGSKAHLHIEDETHGSVIANHREEMLTDLLACL